MKSPNTTSLEPQPDLSPVRPDNSSAKVDRRFFLGSTAAAAISLGVGAHIAPATLVQAPASPVTHHPRPAPKARNVIFMVSDGMSFGTLTLADMYCRLHERRESHWIAFMRRPGVRRGLFRTESLDSPVTDSAAAGSAWACGHKVRNGSLNITDDGVQRLPLLIQASQSGKAVGLVSTTRITHATPASFFATVPRRDWEGLIARQMMTRGFDVALGGGSRFFPPSLLSEHPSTNLIHTRAQLLELDKLSAADPARSQHPLLGLFADMHVPYVLDRDETIPSLADMTQCAIGRLRDRPNGFVLQVEGGRIDHAAHANDAPSLIAEQLDFDKAIKVVLDFAADRDDTLVIITTDHGNANPGLTIYGKEAHAALARVPQAKHSFEWIKRQLSDLKSSDDRAAAAPALLEQAAGLSLSAEEKRFVQSAYNGQRTAPFMELASIEPVMGGVLANHFGIGFVSGNHTSDMVEVTAFGPGADTLPPVGHNADLHPMIERALALEPGKLLDDMRDPVEFPKPPSND